MTKSQAVAAVIAAARETKAWLRQMQTGLVIVPDPVKQVAGRKYDLLLESLAALDAAPDEDAPAAPGHTDLMVTPESLDKYLEDNPPPTTSDLESLVTFFYGRRVSQTPEAMLRHLHQNGWRRVPPTVMLAAAQERADG